MKQFRIGISDFEIEKAKMKMRVLVARSQNPQSESRNPQFLGLICAKVFALCSLLLAPCSAVEAQQPTKIPRIGILSPGSSAFPASAYYDSFRQGLRELGYIEGKNIFIEIRYAEGKQDQLSDFATELVKLKVDVIVTSTRPGVLAAKNATSAIPIVFAAAGDPVRAGLDWFDASLD